MSSSSDVDPPLDPEAARVLSRVRRLMGISVALTGLAIAAVLLVVGLRMMQLGDAHAPAPSSVTLPKGARVVATTATADRLVLTVDVGGATEIHLFDLKTLAPRGRLKVTPEP
jgi:hypothetical protein